MKQKDSKAKKIPKSVELVRSPVPAKSSYFDKIHEQNKILFKNIKKNLPELEKLWLKVNDHWNYEDGVYRFYHNSFKVYHIQGPTMEIVLALSNLAPEGTKINKTFENIFENGTNKTFSTDHNKNWDKHTRPMLEAFFHAKFFLEMVIKYGKELKEAPECLPSGWAAVLYFYNLR